MLKKLSPVQKLSIYAALGVLALAAAFWLSSRYNPAPPRTITFSGGSAGGAYDAYAKAYATDLAKQGVKVTVLPSAGALENLDNLSLEPSKADVALVQSGVATPKQLESLQGIAAVTYEPVWVFTKPNLKPTTLQELSALNLALPKQGSGAWATVNSLFKTASVATNNNWKDYAPKDAVVMLTAGGVDAVVLVSSIQAPLVQELLNSNYRLMSFSHAQAIARTLPAYTVVTLPRGGINQAQDKPAQDVQLIATQAILTASADLHPALVYLLLDAAQRIHTGGGILHATGQFPNAKVGEFTVAEETTRYFKDGKPWLEKVLPFWLANFIARLLLILIPLIAIAFPIIKLVPELEAFVSKRALQPHYKALHDLEHDYFSTTRPSSLSKPVALAQLSELTAKASNTKVPSDHFKDRYALLQNITVVRARIEAL
jgi:TRAP-type uncharacterized transport system substrate-binding protein